MYDTNDQGEELVTFDWKLNVNIKYFIINYLLNIIKMVSRGSGHIQRKSSHKQPHTLTHIYIYIYIYI